MPKAQPGDLQSADFQSASDGSVWFDQGNVYTDGNGNVTVATLTSTGDIITGGTFRGGQSSAAQAIATGNTVNTAGLRVARCTAAAAATGVALQAGTQQGQEVYVVNESAAANSIAFTTNVATAFTLAGATAAHFIWDSVTALWYHCV